MKLYYRADKDPVLPIDGDNKPNGIRLRDCPECGRGFGLGGNLRYPFFVPTKHGSKELKRAYRVPRSLDPALTPDCYWEAYARFRELISQEAPKAGFVPAGTEFGLIHLCVGEAVDVAAPKVGALICKRSVADRLIGDGHKIEVYPTVIQSGHRHVQEEYVEMFAQPLASKARVFPGVLCDKCLRFDPKWNESLPVDMASIPPQADLFRVRERPAVILAKEHLANALSKFNSPNVGWAPVQVL